MDYVAINPDSKTGRHDTRELGFAAVARHRRHGCMREPVQAVLDDLKQQGVRRVWACCIRENEASAAFFRSLGFEFQREGAYHPANDHAYASLKFRIAP